MLTDGIVYPVCSVFISVVIDAVEMSIEVKEVEVKSVCRDK